MSFLQDLQNPEFFNNVTASTGQREFFKPGFFKSTISAVSEVAVKNQDINTHAMLLVTFTGLDGEGKGIEIDKRFNIRNPNQQSVDIGKSEILALFHVLGLDPLRVTNLEQMKNKPLWLKIKNQLPNDKGRTYPEVAFYYAMSFVPPFIGVEPGYVPPAVVAPQAMPAVAAPAGYGATANAAAAAYGADDDIPF